MDRSHLPIPPDPSTIKLTDIHNCTNIIFNQRIDGYKPYYFLSNYYTSAPITVQNIKFPTSEHYYQWQRFQDPIIKNRIFNAVTPDIASQIAQTNNYLLIPKFDINGAMLNALRAKFNQYPELGNELLLTGNRPLVQHNIDEVYWSDGGDGSGANNLGRLLAQVRQELTLK